MQAEALVALFHHLMLNMFRMLIHPSSGACDLFVELFHGLYCSGSMCVGVILWFGWGGVVSVCRLKHYWSVHAEIYCPSSIHSILPLTFFTFSTQFPLRDRAIHK